MSYNYTHPHPAVTTDTVLFTIRDHRLKVLLIRRGNDPFKDSWALPGGFVDIDEDLAGCASRELEQETGMAGAEQLYHLWHAGPRPEGTGDVGRLLCAGAAGSHQHSCRQ